MGSKPSYATFSSSLFSTNTPKSSTNQSTYNFDSNSGSNATTSVLSSQIGPIGSSATTSNLQNLTGYSSINVNTPVTQKQALSQMSESVTRIQNSFSCADFHLKHNFHSNAQSVMNLGIHFHLAGLINAETGK